MNDMVRIYLVDHDNLARKGLYDLLNAKGVFPKFNIIQEY